MYLSAFIAWSRECVCSIKCEYPLHLLFNETASRFCQKNKEVGICPQGKRGDYTRLAYVMATNIISPSFAAFDVSLPENLFSVYVFVRPLSESSGRTEISM